MPKVTEALRDAQALADFSNLEPAKMNYFRNNYPDFVPSKWWDCLLYTSPSPRDLSTSRMPSSA